MDDAGFLMGESEENGASLVCVAAADTSSICPCNWCIYIHFVATVACSFRHIVPIIGVHFPLITGCVNQFHIVTVNRKDVVKACVIVISLHSGQVHKRSIIPNICRRVPMLTVHIEN